MATENKIRVLVYKDELQSIIEKYEQSSYSDKVKFTVKPDEQNYKYKHSKCYWVVFETDSNQFLEGHVTTFIFSAGVHHGKKPQ